jgi:SNF2 family DNA or RNA helicase
MTIYHNWGDYEIAFGKHSGTTYNEMARNQRGYLEWMGRTFHENDTRSVAARAVLNGQPIPDGTLPELKGTAPPATKNTAQKSEPIMLVSFKSGRIGVQAPFSEKDRCKDLSERKWEKPYWVCPGGIIEEVAAAFPDGIQSETFKRRLAEARALSEKATQTESEFSLDHFGNGKELMPFQRAGLEFAEATGGNCLISDQMGLGKTIQALSYLALHPDMRPAVIVCPASLKLNWQREADAWLETEDRIEVINGGKVHETTADIVIINYDILKKWLPELHRREAQILADESHALKGKSQRTKAAKELAATVPHKILLTGTPVLNRPNELWNQLQIIDPDAYPNGRFMSWHKRFTAAEKNRFGWDFSGASNLDELAASLKTIMIRRTKEQVLPELPAKRRSTVLIPIDNRAEYNRADKEFLTWVAEQKGLESAERVSHVEQLAKVEYLRQIAIRGKMKQALAWIENFLESGEKLVVFATHKETIHALEREYGTMAVKIDGSVSSEQRQKAVDAFQNDPNVKLFIGNIQAAGVGITLTAASNVVFLELGWTPALMEQAEDRLHRISQKNAVNCWYLLAEKTIDASIAAMLERKREVIDRITEEEGGIGFDLFNLVKEA